MSRKRRKSRYSRDKTRSRKSSGKSSYEKGHLFEDVIAKYFEIKGFRVKKNVRMHGVSGAVHEIDVLLEKHNMVSIVEVKNYRRPIPKEWVMKAYNVAKDIGASDVYIVSSKGFTPDAVKVAMVLGVKLLDLDEIVKEVKMIKEKESIKMFHVKPAYGSRLLKEYASKFLLKKFFKPIEKVGKHELEYHPFYVLKAELTYVVEVGTIFKREIEKRKNIRVILSATCPCLLDYEDNHCSLIKIPALNDNELELLQIIMDKAGDKGISYDDLLDITEWSTRKLSRILNSLIKKEVIEEDEVGEEDYRYYSLIPSPEELDEIHEIVLGEEPLESGKPTQGKIIEPKISVPQAKALVRKLYGVEVLDAKLVYLPVYKVKLESLRDNTYRYIKLLAVEDEPILFET